MTDDPIALFQSWLAEAEAAEPNDANAMALATTDAAGDAAVRMVLLKGCDIRGFVFFTNRESRKADHLRENAYAALLFHWKSLRRQVRVEGSVELTSEEEANAYFATRGRDSQLGAWASDQSRPLDDRTTLERRFEQAKARYKGMEVPRPPYWGGYRVVPDNIEFWQDGAHRLHDRQFYSREADGNWGVWRLYP